LQDAQSTLQGVIRDLQPPTAFQGRTYIQRLQADAAAAAAAAAQAQAGAGPKPAAGAEPETLAPSAPQPLQQEDATVPMDAT